MISARVVPHKTVAVAASVVIDMMKPRVLLTATNRWIAVAKLAVALNDAGFLVSVLGPSGHPAEKVRTVHKTYLFSNQSLQRSLKKALAASRPDLVVPCDDAAMLQLHALYRSERGRGTTAALIESSLGDSAGFAMLESRDAVMRLAQNEGVSIPATRAVETVEELRAWLNQHGYPAVLKADGTSGGEGVRVVASFEEAMQAFEGLRRPPLVARAAKRLIVNRDSSLLRPCLSRKQTAVSVQAFVDGRETSSSVACWKGEVLAAIHFEVLRRSMPRGPSSVLRLVENPQASSAIEALVGRLKLSGLCGFDFMIDSQSGEAMLIELNARATQTCHLALGAGRDLAASLWSAVAAAPQSARKSELAGDVIALFPQEWKAHPDSAFLQTAYHDVPWREPDLVRACLEKHTPQEKWYSSENLSSLYARLPWHKV